MESIVSLNFIEFANPKVVLNSNGISQELEFDTGGETISFRFVKAAEGIWFVSNEVVVLIAVNRLIDCSSVSIAFCQESLVDEGDFGVDTLLVKYQLGVVTDGVS